MSVRVRGASMLPWWLLVTGIAWLLISLIVLRFDVTSIAAVGALLGVILLMAGANEFVITFAQPSWRWAHAVVGVVGILEVFLAFWASQQMFAPRAALILVWVGFAAMFHGFIEIFFAFEVRRLSKELSTAV